jgi:hypothetical protein
MMLSDLIKIIFLLNCCKITYNCFKFQAYHNKKLIFVINPFPGINDVQLIASNANPLKSISACMAIVAKFAGILSLLKIIVE